MVGKTCSGMAAAIRSGGWQKHGVVLHPRPGRWNSGQVKAAVISPVQSNGRYVMFYLGEERPWHTAIGLAFSDDLRHWQEPEDSLIRIANPVENNGKGLDKSFVFVYHGV